MQRGWWLSYTLTVSAPTITISPSSLPAATAEQSYSQTITASGGTAPYTYSENGALPSGITLSSGGTLSGTTTVTGSFSIIVTATDANNFTGSQNYTLTVNAPAPTVTGIIPTSGATSGGTLVTITGTNFTSDATVKIGGVAAANVSVPSGTTINCLTPTGTAGQADVVVAEASGSATDSGAFTYKTGGSYPPVTISPTSLYPATAGSPYADQNGNPIDISASDGNGGPYTFTESGLPSGLNLNSSTGLISGTPPTSTTCGSYSVDISAQDNASPPNSGGEIYSTANNNPFDVCPAWTTCYYVVGDPSDTIVTSWGYNAARIGALGGQQGILVILDFGQPQTWTDTQVEYGTYDFDQSFPNIGYISGVYLAPCQITEYTEDFLQGYEEYTEGNGPFLHLAIGTNNYAGTPTSAHGSSWGTMVSNIDAWIDTPPDNNYKNEWAVGASDMEVNNWDSNTSTESWVEGYNSVTSIALVDFGDDDGLINDNSTSNTGWTGADVWFVASGRAKDATDDAALPEVYLPPTIAQNWQELSQWASTTTDSKLTSLVYNNSNPKTIQFWGELTEFEWPQYPGQDNSPAQGWSQLYNALNTPGQNTNQSTLLYSSDITYGNPSISLN